MSMVHQVDEKRRQRQIENRKSIARDKIARRIDLFIDSNIAEFGDLLDGDEIRNMIASKARSYSEHVILGYAEP